MWEKITAGRIYPDAVVQLAQAFESDRSADLFVIAENGWLFFKKKRGTHGSISREDMHIPLLIRGPNIPKRQQDFARTVDLYPTILNWFGITVDNHTHDGRRLF